MAITIYDEYQDQEFSFRSQAEFFVFLKEQWEDFGDEGRAAMNSMIQHIVNGESIEDDCVALGYEVRHG